MKTRFWESNLDDPFDGNGSPDRNSSPLTFFSNIGISFFRFGFHRFPEIAALWPFITQDHVLRSLPMTSKLIRHLNTIKNMSGEFSKDSKKVRWATIALLGYFIWDIFMSTNRCYYLALWLALRTHESDSVIACERHLLCTNLKSRRTKDDDFFEHWLLFIIYIWAKIDLWAFTVFFEAMIFKWMNLKIMTSGHIVELPVVETLA